MFGNKGLVHLTEIEQVVKDAAAVTDRALPLDPGDTEADFGERLARRAEAFRQVLCVLLEDGYQADGPYLDGDSP